MSDNQKTCADNVDGEKLIDGCSFTVKWLLESLRKNDKEFQQKFGNKNVKKVTAYDISDGRGVASVVLRCTVFFTDSDESYSTILKVPGLEVFKQVQIKYNGKCDMLDESLIKRFNVNHQKECKFYNIMAPLLKGSIPKVYKTEDWILNEKERCVHMEDLSQKGKTFTYFESVNLNQIKSFVRNLAKIHKSNLVADEKIWKGKFVEDDQFFTFYHEILETQIEPFLKTCSRESKSFL
uniref:Uncharacterized protein n=1 Tax=Panagrolaimus superbus TaxID=310955 RepID=A0A914YD61_9BILA